MLIAIIKNVVNKIFKICPRDRHGTYTNDPFKRRIASFYRSCSKSCHGIKMGLCPPPI